MCTGPQILTNFLNGTMITGVSDLVSSPFLRNSKVSCDYILNSRPTFGKALVYIYMKQVVFVKVSSDA